ncbi:hypothetical protein [Chitiniphilus shinanonensis]|uniref:hypothetical protein n=1 Tax=Chitiniphilus shinanonensis TaxID=553088 RepID=UPI003073C4C9
MTRPMQIVLALSLVLGLAAALWLGYLLGHHNAPVPEDTSPAAQQIQPDGSVIAARIPDPSPSPPPHQLPKGSKEERRVSVTVRPTSQPTPVMGADGTLHCECPPATVDLSLVQVAGGRRVIASSPDGQVIRALDVLIDPAPLPPPSRPWAAGISYGANSGTVGAWVERDLSRIRLGLDLQQREGGDLDLRLRAGWVF